MENNPLYRLYLELKDRIDVLATKGTSTGSGDSSMDVSDLVLRIRELENRPSMEKTIKELSATMATLVVENNELKNKLDVLHKFENIEGRLYNLEVEPKVPVEQILSRLNTLESNDFEQRLASLESRFSSFEQFNNQNLDLVYRIGEMEKRPDLTERLNGLESIIANLKN